MINTTKIEYHEYDVLVVGAGGAGLNAAQVASQYVKTAVISEVYPTRSHTITKMLLNTFAVKLLK